MYLEQKLDENSSSYNLNVALFIIGAGLEKVKTELKEIFAAHEAFRSYYKEENGVPVRIVSDDIPEISEKTADSIDEVKAQIDVNNKPFDLCSGIPVRAAIYSVADGSIAVHICVHHISFDGISAKLVFEEMTDRLTGKANSAQNADLSDFDDYFSDGSRQKGMAFYKEMFADGVPQNEMPTKGKRPKIYPICDKETCFGLTEEKTRELKETARSYGVSDFELIFAAIAMTLGKYTGSEDVVLGIPTNKIGRAHV